VREYLPARPFYYSGNSDRARWQRETPGGMLSRLAPEAEEAAELAEAKRMADEHEFAYGSRPDLGVFTAKIRHEGPKGVCFSGTTREVADQFRMAGLGCAIVSALPALGDSTGGVSVGPRNELARFGNPEVAAEAHAAVTRPRFA
jgi:hypothetical protein